MSKQAHKTHQPWTEEQITALVKIVIQRGTDMRAVMKAHNKLFGMQRTLKAVSQQYRRLREVFTYQSYKEAWGLMGEHPDLFTKRAPEVSKSDRRISELERELQELRTLLDQRTDPQFSLGVQ